MDTTCWCGGKLLTEAAAGTYRCSQCGEITNDWDEDEDAAEEGEV